MSYKTIIVDIGATGFPQGSFLPKNGEILEPYEFHLFEPRWDRINKDDTSKIRKKLEKLGLNNDNVFLYNIALSNKKDVVDFYLTQKGNCSSLREPNDEILHNRKDITTYEKIQTPTDTLNNILGHLSHIDYLKLDTQGSEYEILLGADEILPRVLNIKCEVEYVEMYKNQKTKNDIVNLLSQHNFKVVGSANGCQHHCDMFFKNKKFNENTNI